MSLRKSKFCKSILFVFLLLAGCGKSDNPLDGFEESKPAGVKAFYAYPSTVRMLGKIMQDTDQSVFGEVKQARLFIDWKEGETDNRMRFLSLKEEALNSQFEELLTISSKHSDVTVLVKEKKIPVYMLFSMGEDADYILELEGSISMKTLRDIGTLDVENVVDVINLGKPKQIEKGEIQENK